MLALTIPAVVAGGGAAQAAVIPVTTTADVVDPLDGLTSLREAITTANGNGAADTIQLAMAATYQLTDCALGALAYTEATDLTITGNGSTIEQTCADERIIDKSGSNTAVLSLTGLTLTGVTSPGGDLDGAAVRAQSRLVLTDVDISGIDAGFSGSVVAVDFGPAAVDLELQSVTIDGNTGRAVDNLNPAGILVNASAITNNTGAGVSLGDGTPLTITNTTIAGNGGHGVATSGQGNGIQPVVQIAGSTIENNGQGGFLCLQSCRTVTVTNSQIIGNGLTAAAGNGGGLVTAMFTDGFPPLQSVTITGSTISGNHADHDGGGLLVAASGQIDGPDSPLTSIVDSTIDGNTAACAACDGGGVAVHVGDLSVAGSTISDNVAGANGGGIEQVRVSYDEIVDPSAFTMTASEITDNTAGGDGGGAWLHNSSTSISASVIADNTAAGSGGGLRVGGNFTDVLFESGDAVVTDSTITGNDATTGGGLSIGFPDGSRARLTNVTIDANAAVVAGGGFAVGPTELLDVLHSTITGNSAPAGANLATSGPTTIGASAVAQAAGGGTNCAELPGAPPLTVPHLTSTGLSWYDDATCAPVAGDVVDAGGDPELGPLGDNGGPTPTRLPAATSPLGGLVPVPSCLTPTDQRGVTRPQGAACEAGAVEIAEAGVAPIMGTGGADVLIGTNGDDHIIGLGGNDLLLGRGGADRLEGGPGHDLLRGGPGADHLIGGPGIDVLIAESAADLLEGGPGLDLCFVPWRLFPFDC